MSACIVGWSHTPFGKLVEHDVESLVAEVAQKALQDAGIACKDVCEIFVGHFNSGFATQDFSSSLVLGALPDLRFRPATRLENACASGSAAVHAGVRAASAAGRGYVLAIGVEKMSNRSGAEANDILLHASYHKEEASVAGGFAGIFGTIAQAYFQRYGDHSDVLARIAVKSHKNGALNPLAHLRKALDFEFCSTVSEKNPRVAGPLRRTDCSPISDGAAALVICDEALAKSHPKAVRFRSAVQVNDFLPMSKRDLTRLEAAERAWQQAFESAGINLADLDLVETHDCFTIAELLEYEAMGLTPPGQGKRAILEGWTEAEGRLPINPSGGLKSKGHPIGATGVSMHVLAAAQVAGVAGPIQVSNASVAGVFNMGGSGVANYVSILERLV